MILDIFPEQLSVRSRSAWVFSGVGSPEGVIAQGVGSIYTDITDPKHPVTWKKTSGGGTSTGWVQELSI